MLIEKNIITNVVGNKVTGVIHIGGHFGEEQEFYEELGVDHVVYFEPHPESFANLTEQFEENENVTLLNFALGDEDGVTKTMFCETVNKGQSNSLLKPVQHKNLYPGIVFDDGSIEVEQRTLDSVVDEGLLPENVNFNFLNIDVQGYEMHVFRGAEKTLTNFDWIISEFNLAEMYEGCSKLDDMNDFLAEHGFKPNHGVQFANAWGDMFYERIEE